MSIGQLEIWIHSRQFPEATSLDDANWVNVSARCRAPGAEIFVAGPFLELAALQAWRDQCQALFRTLTGEAILETYEPNLKVSMNGDGIGHVFVEVDITPDLVSQRHHLEFQVDQTYLPALVQQLSIVLDKFPVREAVR